MFCIPCTYPVDSRIHYTRRYVHRVGLLDIVHLRGILRHKRCNGRKRVTPFLFFVACCFVFGFLCFCWVSFCQSINSLLLQSKPCYAFIHSFIHSIVNDSVNVFHQARRSVVEFETIQPDFFIQNIES